MRSVLRPLVKPVTARPGQPIARQPRSNAVRDTCTTATLQRGRVYYYANIPFERGVPLAIDEKLCKTFNYDGGAEFLATELEDLFEEITDSDNEQFAKPIFEVKRNQPRPMTAEEKARAEKPRRVRQFVEWPEHQATADTEGRASRIRTVGVRR